MQTEISVSRPRVLPYERIVEIFRQDLNGKLVGGTVTRMVVATATVTAGKVRDLCNTPQSTVWVDVLEDPTHGKHGLCDNPAHALICGVDAETRQTPKAPTRGMAKLIRKACTNRLVE
ncbi:MAG: hypothetical protein IV093_07310 [Rubrivivax sp.]|nr:hypothetical protein [Rubrivivax sp.]